MNAANDQSSPSDKDHIVQKTILSGPVALPRTERAAPYLEEAAMVNNTPEHVRFGLGTWGKDFFFFNYRPLFFSLSFLIPWSNELFLLDCQVFLVIISFAVTAPPAGPWFLNY